MSVSDKGDAKAGGQGSTGQGIRRQPLRCKYCGVHVNNCFCPPRCRWCGRQVPKGKDHCGESKCREGIRRVPQADERGNPINPQGFVCEWCGISIAGTLYLPRYRGWKVFHCGAMDCMKGLRELCREEDF